MAFSLRTLIVVITVGGVWLAALLSGSTLYWAVVAQVSMMFIALSLGLAICAADLSRRAFWIGFFVVALFNLALTSLPLGDVSRPSFHLQGRIADLIQVDVADRPGSQEHVPVTNQAGGTSYVSPAVIAYDEERRELRGALAALLSLIWGGLAGSICWWFAHQRRSPAVV